MRVDTFSYELPADRIAQQPADDREAARLMVLLGEGVRRQTTVGDLASLLPKGALVVLNDTRARSPRARLHIGEEARDRREGRDLPRAEGRRAKAHDRGNGAGEERGPERDRATSEVAAWRALGKASKPLKFDTDILVGAAEAPPGTVSSPGLQLSVRLLGRAEDDGLLEVGLSVRGDGSVEDAIRALGHVPLPPYIKRDDRADDADRYQTVFARVDGAVAAPTAGLHVTRALLGRLAVRECEVATITLHVGLGTFQPVSVEDLDQHPMHNERFEVTRTVARAIALARERGAPVVAIGTTVVRALESAADPDRPGFVRPMAGDTRLLIQPNPPSAPDAPSPIKVVDLLLTNFHLPRSTLLAASFAPSAAPGSAS